jgi:RNA polymerase sigma-70 factor, ECF subfamily
MSRQSGNVDPTQFESLTIPHFDAIFRAAYQMTREIHDAEDLIQETYLRAFRSFNTFRGANVKAWLFTILRNAYIDSYRRRQREPAYNDIDLIEQRNGAGEAAGTVMGSAEDVFLSRLLSDEIQNALRSLPPEYRLAVLLADVEGFSYAEIAEIVQAPIGTVMSRLHRGRKRLYRQLSDYVQVIPYPGETAS